mgnify:CR=1 FL=1
MAVDASPLLPAAAGRVYWEYGGEDFLPDERLGLWPKVAAPASVIGAELVGIFVGSMIGPRTSKYIPDIWLKRLFVLLAFYVGIRYTTKGFLGYSILPPF